MADSSLKGKNIFQSSYIFLIVDSLVLMAVNTWRFAIVKLNLLTFVADYDRKK